MLRCFIAVRNLDVTTYTTKRQYAVKNCNVDYSSDNLSSGRCRVTGIFDIFFNCIKFLFEFFNIQLQNLVRSYIGKTISFYFINRLAI